MATLEADIGTDKVVVRYHLSKPYGQTDEDGSLEIPFSSVARLPPIPEELCERESYRRDIRPISIPALGCSITFIITSYQESMGQNEEVLHGPFASA